MKVKMLTLDAGPDGVRQPGQVCDLPTNEAKALIASGYAVDATNLKDAKRRASPEQATARRGKSATETADAGDDDDEDRE